MDKKLNIIGARCLTGRTIETVEISATTVRTDTYKQEGHGVESQTAYHVTLITSCGHTCIFEVVGEKV